MRKEIFIIALFLLLIPITGHTQDISFTILYNNVPYDRNLTTAWGFSCLIEGLEKTILFDTGGEGGILLSNMEKMKVDPQKIDVVVISHIHWDHWGGLLNFLDKNNKVTVCLPASLPHDFKEKVRRKGAKVIIVHNPVKICENVYSTGELGTWIKEQSLVIDTPKGLMVITGCAHPGVVNIVRNAQRLLKKKRVYLVLGGFHLLAYREPQVRRIIRDLKEIGVKKVGPSHCTGGRPIELFREAWGEDFFDLGCGAKLKIP
jgi:7,8-dihydropterin-6-yl-methyl-4-(beta-D-ribofuranosyl)aminobenzene 5'-phosphate synthase